MASPLIVAPAELGLLSPALGPWFTGLTTPLAAPDARLSVPVALGGATWLPPAGGILSLHVVTESRLRPLAPFRDGAGAAAFSHGSLVALFVLLPEVQVRLRGLLATVPSAEPGAPAGRPPIRAFALELPSVATLADFERHVEWTWQVELPDADAATLPRRKAEYLGLGLAEGGDDLMPSGRPMAVLARPGAPRGQESTLLRFKSGALDGRLWAFDARGRAVDPGAVARWMQWLVQDGYTNLWHDATATGAAVATAAVADRRTIQLVDPHEGPVPAALLARVAPTNVDGDGAVRAQVDAALEVAFAFTAAPTGTTPDDAPVPRVAALPAGTYRDALRLWVPPDPAATTPPPPRFTRDFVRVAVVDVERHLVGIGRDVADQQRASTRVRVGRTATPALLGTTDEVLAAIGAALGGTTPARVVAPVIERETGAREAPALVAGPPPGRLVAVTTFSEPGQVMVHPLLGSGTSVREPIGDRFMGQAAVVEVRLEPRLAGAWVRAWPFGFDELGGAHSRLSGGGGLAYVPAGADFARAYVLMPLPDGMNSDPPPLMAMDVMVLTATGEAHFQDLRFRRPGIRESALTLDAGGAVAGATFVVCETGRELPSPLAPGAVAGGMSLVARIGDEFRAIARPLPVELCGPGTVGGALARGDLVALTPPAFASTPRGETEGFAPAGVVVDRIRREGIVRQAQIPTVPMPSQERLEVVAVTSDGVTGTAAIGATPLLARYHEVGAHHLGHPGVPAAIETHGAGARLSGPAAIEAHAYARERTAGLAQLDPLGPEALLVGARSTPALVWDLLDELSRTVPAWTPPVPADVAGPSGWAAVLRTVARGTEGEPFGADGLDLAGLYPTSDAVERLLERMRSTGGLFPAPASGGVWATAVTQINALARQAANAFAGDPRAQALTAAIARALDRRLKVSRDGATEGLTSLRAAVGRAQDFIYVETPALTDDGSTPASLVGAIAARLGEVPALRVLACVPARLAPGTPRRYVDVREHRQLEAVRRLRDAGGERFAIFAPAAGTGRTLRLASTAVVVDDAYALVGTTHLTRRGLTFDSSLAVACFDEQLADGRPAEVLAFRRELVAGRLGLPPAKVPDDPAELVGAVARYVAQGLRVSVAPPIRPALPVLEPDAAFWDRDGRADGDLLVLAQSVTDATDQLTRDEDGA